MAQKAKYKTKQMEELLTYLKSVPGQHVTVHDICAYFQEKGTPIGMTTVYRHLDYMVEQGMVAKYDVDGIGSACFEYLDEQEHCHRPACYHFKCEKCGQLLHLQCDEMEHLGLHVLEHHEFEMDFARTVIYGTCEECRLQNAQAKSQGGNEK